MRQINKILTFCCFSLLFFSNADATTISGNVTFGTDNSDSVGYTGGDNISVVSGGSLTVTATSGGIISVNDTFSISKDFLHDGNPTLLSDPTFHGQGSFAFTGDNALVEAQTLKVNNNFINGDGTSVWNLTLDVDSIKVVGNFNTLDNSKLTINSDYTKDPTLTGGNIIIADGLYMGHSAPGTESVHINSANSADIYKIVSIGNFIVNGDIKSDVGTLDISAVTASVSGDVIGNVNFDIDTLSTGGANLVANSDWKQRLQHTSDGSGGFLGNLLSDGNINSTGDILIGGDVDGDLNIYSDADMWVGKDLLGYWSIDVNNLYVLGDVNGAGEIIADNVNIGGDLSGDIKIDTNSLNVDNDVLGGTKFRPNLPTGTDGFHVNPDTGLVSDFKQIDMTVGGTYYFDNDSYLQLVLNSSTAASGGTAAYEHDLDDALIKVGGFDASGVTNPPNFNDMDSTPNIEILVDNMTDMISKIRLAEVDPMGTINLGMLDFVGVWFYWDDDSDNINDRRLFQEARLSVDNNNIYATLAMMDSIRGIVSASPNAGQNDLEIAQAVDDLILGRVRQYPGYIDDNLANYYTSVMRLLFKTDDVYYETMLNGGSGTDAIDVMVSGSPSSGISFVRGFGLSDVAGIGSKLAVSNRLSRNAVADQMLEDFIWKRYYDKKVAWGRVGIGSDIWSFNFGVDAKAHKMIFGLNAGYNSFDYNAVDGASFNVGGYTAYELNKKVRLYGNANMAVHSATAKVNNVILGNINSGFSTADITFEAGALHKIIDTYLTGRGYLSLGRLGGYKFTEKHNGQDFMDIDVDAQVFLAPGYELNLGKDIWFSVGSFMRPSLRVGAEYDILGSNSNRTEFKFSQSNNWRKLQCGEIDPLWLRFGGQVDFSFIVGTNFSVGYEVLKNGDFTTNQIKINGVYRF